MKKRWIFMLTLLLVFCSLLPASAQAALSKEKQALINCLSLNPQDLPMELSQTANGVSEYTVNRLDGSFLALAPELSALPGAKLQMEYQLNTPQQQIGTKWKVTIMGKEYQGDIFLVGNKIIFTKDIIQLIKDINPDINVPSAATLPRYLYMDTQELENLWPAFMQTEFHKTLPTLNNLLVFFIEAIPDNCLSKNGDKIVLSIDQQKLPQVVFSILEKVKANPDEFASLLAKLASAYEPQSYDKVKADILQNIMLTIKEKKWPTEEKLRTTLAESGFTLNSLTFTTNEGVNQHKTFELDFTVKDNATEIARLKATVDQQKISEETKGKFAIDFELKTKEQKMDTKMNYSGNYHQAKDNAGSDALLKINATSQQLPALNLELKMQSQAQLDKNIKLETPVLTPLNSVNLDSLE